MRALFLESIDKIGAEAWNEIAGTDYPFTRYEYLYAMEQNTHEVDAACCSASGWQPHHLAIEDENHNLLAVAPLYIKAHSYGEYVFDFAWADAYHRNNIDYYPKLLCAIPFTPATGPRLLLNKRIVDTQRGLAIRKFAVDALKEHCFKEHIQSAHILFASKAEAADFTSQSLLIREAVQFHWFNIDANQEPYQDFEGFLGALKARKRKAIRKERQQVMQQDLVIERLTGTQLTDEVWKSFFLFYQRTYAKRSGHGGYLPEHFFRNVGSQLNQQIMLAAAFKRSDGENRMVAAALNFFSAETLYGRYWGCTEETEFLHFELCYYQGIEFCIEKKMRKFDAGAQGEHKIQRGFIPVATRSAHYILNEQFAAAIDNFITREKDYNRQYVEAVSEALPYREVL